MMEPITRKEKYLAKLNGQDISIDPPITNEEYYLAYLCGEDYGLPTPVTLDEMYLAAMCGVIYILPMPITRLQRIWKQLIETGESDITPGTREELYWVGVDLWDIVYSTVSGNPVMFTAIHPDLLKQLKVAFSPVQDLHGYDSPWIDSEINREPYTLRGVKGTATRIGNFLYDKLVGGTIAWNQVIPVSAASLSRTANGVVFVDNRDGTYSVTTESGGATANEYIAMQSTNLPQSAKDHVYLFNGTPANGSDSTYRSYAVSSGFAQKFDYGEGYIVKATDIAPITIVLAYIYSGANISSAITFKPQFIDLTQMFGSTIADYIYSLETANAGAGVAWFRKLFPNPYYAYDAGTLMSVKTSAHITTGFNQWDEEWINGRWAENNGVLNPAFTTYLASKNKIPVLPNTTYYFNIVGNPVSSREIVWYDADGNWISDAANTYQNGTFTTPSNAYFMTFNLGSTYGATYDHDICINLSAPTRDGEYEPYVEHNYPLDSDLELRGIPKLDADNALYYDGDIYQSDGTVTRRYGVVDLGTLTYGSISGVWYGGVPLCAPRFVGLVSSRYSPNLNAAYNALAEGEWTSLGGANTSIWIKDSSYATKEELKASLSGVYLVYELENSVTETADPFTNPQSVSEAGTEEYVDSRAVKIPVGHETYHANVCPISGWTGVNVWQAGKNLLDPATKEQTSQSVARWCYANGFMLRAGQTYTLSSDTAGTTVYIDDKATGANLKNGGTATYTPTQDTLVYFRAYLSSGIEAVNLQLELGSTATAYVPYNPLSRSISIEFHAMGANKWDEEWEVGLINATTGQNTDSTSYSRTKNYIHVEADTTYWMCIPAETTIYLRFYDADKNYLGFSQFNNPRSFVPSTISPSFATAAFMRFCWDGTTYNHDIGVNYPSSVTAYEPYTNTAYSGTLDIVTGQVEITSGTKKISDLNFNINTGRFLSGTIAEVKAPVNNFIIADGLLCEAYKPTTSSRTESSEGNMGIAITRAGTLSVRDERFSTAEDFKTAMGNTMFTFALAEPLTIQLTPQEVSSLLGTNTMWSDTNGDLTVKYRSK